MNYPEQQMLKILNRDLLSNPKLVNVAALIKVCRYATARGYARRAVQSTTVMFLQPVIYFGRAFPNWRVWVIPVAEMQGFHTFVSKNPVCFSDGSMSIQYAYLEEKSYFKRVC